MAHRIGLNGFVLIAVTALTLATACKILPEDVCQANGAGIHCHPCVREAYVVCSTKGMLSVERCQEGNIWDPFMGRCTDNAEVPECPPPAPLAPRQLLQSDKPQQSWMGRTAEGVSSLVKSLFRAVPAVKTAKYQLKTPASAALPQPAVAQGAVTTSSPSLRIAMMYRPAATAAMPMPAQLQNMQQELAHAATMQKEAFQLIMDADAAELAAAELFQAAKDIMHSTDPNSSSSSSISASAKAEQLLLNAGDAREAAAEMHAAAEDLLQIAAAETAGVAMAITASGSDSSSISGSNGQRYYSGSMLGAIVGTLSANLVTDPFARAKSRNKDTITVPDNYDDFYSSNYVYGDIESYHYEEDQNGTAGPSSPNAPQVVMTVTSHPIVRGLGVRPELTPTQVTLLGHLEDIHGEHAWAQEEVLDSVASDAVDGNRPLPFPGWRQYNDRLAMSHQTVDLSAVLNDHYYHDSDYDAPEITYSSSIIMAGALQDRIVKLAAQAAATAAQQQQQQHGSSSGGSSSAAAGDLQPSPFPLRMTVKREQEMLQLAQFFDSLHDSLSELAKAHLTDLDFTDTAVLDLELVGGLPALHIGEHLSQLLPEAEATRLHAILTAQMAELFADFVLLSDPDDYSDLGLEFAAPNSHHSNPDAAPLPLDPFTEPKQQQQQQQQQPETVTGSQTVSSSNVDVEVVNAVVREFEDAELIQQLDSALLQLEQQQQQQVIKQQNGDKAAGLILPGSQQAHTQQILI